MTIGQAFNEQSLALKEWAVTVDALLQGELIFVMRKGGISEETKRFELQAPTFLLMPAFEHQKEHLLKSAYRGRIQNSVDEHAKEPEKLFIKGYADVIEDIEIFDELALAAIFEQHIWTEQFAFERLKWKKKQPLHLLILRVHKFEEPLEYPMQPNYSGCKSWITIEEQVKQVDANPALTDEAFQEKYIAVQKSLKS